MDESVEGRIASALSAAGHDVSIVGVDHPAALDDPVVLSVAHREERVLVTNDTDFGELAFRLRLPHSGIILMRLPMMSTHDKTTRLLEVIDTDFGNDNGFIVIVPQGVRIRR